jgi:cytochrome c553
MRRRLAPRLAGLAALATVGLASAAPGDPALFDPVASVVMTPRCVNCHQVEAPRQKDIGVLHAQQVVRGKDGHGSAVLHCAACHQAANTAQGKVPGAPNWHLAPLSMRWQGLDKKGVCEQMRDPKRNGNRKGGAEVIEHMKTDPLVLWAWNPGANRTQPPMSHEDFVKVLEKWADAGMPCPQ